VPLNRERVLQAALALADEHGVESLSMRKLAKTLGVEAMSLYGHVRNKDDLLDGLVDLVWAEIEYPEGEWREAMRERARCSSLLDAYVYGWALQEKALPAELNAEVAERMLRFADTTTPYQAEMLREHIATGGYDFEAEFAFGLGVILDGLSGISSPPPAPA